MTDKARLAALEAVAGAVRAYEAEVRGRGGYDSRAIAARWEMFKRHYELDALPAQTVGEVVTLAVWEWKRGGEIRIARVGDHADKRPADKWTRLGTVTLPLEVVR